MEFVWIEPGTFLMGSPASAPTRGEDEGPQHEVSISKGFYLGKFEITQAQWVAVDGDCAVDPAQVRTGRAKSPGSLYLVGRYAGIPPPLKRSRR